MSYEDHPKSNWVVGYNGLSTHFLVVGIPFVIETMLGGMPLFIFPLSNCNHFKMLT
jgi:hypothetical protein